MFTSHVVNFRSLSPSTYPPWLVPATQSMPSPSMDRLRDLAARTRNSRRAESRLRIPNSLSTTSLMPNKAAELGEGSSNTRSTISLISASTPTPCLPVHLLPPAASLDSDPNLSSAPPFPGTRAPAAQSKGRDNIMPAGNRSSSIQPDNKKHKMERKAQRQTALKGAEPAAALASHEADQALFEQILISIAQDDVIANSGLELHRRVNDCARDYLYAKQIVERREHEIAAISAKIEAMQATISDASQHLHRAQNIATEAIRSSINEQSRFMERDALTDTLMRMTDAVTKGNCHDWPRSMVNQYLEHLQAVYFNNKYYCQSPIVSSGIVYVAKHFIFHTDYDDAFEPMLFHLCNRTDYKGFVERARKEDHAFAQQKHATYTARAEPNPKFKTSGVPSDDETAIGEANDVYDEGDGNIRQRVITPGESHPAQLDPTKKASLKNSMPLPPRSSSLPSSVGGTAENPPSRSDPAGGPGSCGKATCSWKHLDVDTRVDVLYSKLEPKPGVPSKAMVTAFLESIAGVEAIFTNGMVVQSPEVKKEVASVIKLIERLNKEHVKSNPVARKLGAVVREHGLGSIHTHEVPGRRAHIDVATAGPSQGCTCEVANQGGQEHCKGKHSDKAIGNGQDLMGAREHLDLLWKAYVSSTAPGKP